VKNRNFEVKGRKAVAYQAPKAACCGCHLRDKCLRSKKTEARQVHIFSGGGIGKLTDEMREKIDTVEGRTMYSKRLGIVEPVFANIRTHKRLDHFTLAGKEKVNIQWLLYCMVHNVGKLAAFGLSYSGVA